jgi:hypothetical protein
LPIPTWSVGQVLASADVNNWFVPLAAYKTADLGRTTTTLTADPDLTVAVAANAVYRVECQLYYKSTATTNGFSWTWTIPAGTTAGDYSALYTAPSGNLLYEHDQWTDSAHTAQNAATAGNIRGVTICGTLATNGSAGSFTVNWASDNATPTTTLIARSHLVLTRIG